MWLKTAIVVVFIGLVISLASGLYFLFKDQGTTRRTLHSLGVRVTLAGLLLVLIAYGIYTGQIRSKAPWDAQLRQQQLQQQQRAPTGDGR